MDRFNTTALRLLASLTITCAALGQSGGVLLRQFETPAALVVVYQDVSPSMEEAENRLAALRSEHPDKLLVRVALYQSQEDEKATEEQSVAGHTTLQNWKVESGRQQALASPMAEAIFVNGFGISRAYQSGTATSAVPPGLVPLRDIACGAFKLSFLHLADGRAGPNHRGFAELSISGEPLFVEDTRYPRFNRFVEPAYHIAHDASRLKITGLSSVA